MINMSLFIKKLAWILRILPWTLHWTFGWLLFSLIFGFVSRGILWCPHTCQPQPMSLLSSQSIFQRSPSPYLCSRCIHTSICTVCARRKLPHLSCLPACPHSVGRRIQNAHCCLYLSKLCFNVCGAPSLLSPNVYVTVCHWFGDGCRLDLLGSEVEVGGMWWRMWGSRTSVETTYVVIFSRKEHRPGPINVGRRSN